MSFRSWWLLSSRSDDWPLFPSPCLLASGDGLLDRSSYRRSCACVRKLIDDASIEDCLLPPASQSSPLRAAMTYSSPRLLRLPRVVPLVVSSRAAVFLFPFLVDSFSWTPLLEPEFSILYDSLEFDFVLANSPDRHRPTRLHHIQTKANLLFSLQTPKRGNAGSSTSSALFGFVYGAVDRPLLPSPPTSRNDVVFAIRQDMSPAHSST